MHTIDEIREELLENCPHLRDSTNHFVQTNIQTWCEEWLNVEQIQEKLRSTFQECKDIKNGIS